MSQVLSRAYNSNLPNSLSNFPLETRDCTSRIPDADISTIFFRRKCPPLFFFFLKKKEKRAHLQKHISVTILSFSFFSKERKKKERIFHPLHFSWKYSLPNPSYQILLLSPPLPFCKERKRKRERKWYWENLSRFLWFNSTHMLLKSNLVPQSVVVTPKGGGKPPPLGCNKTVLLYKENVKGGRSLCRGAASCRQARPPPPPPRGGGEAANAHTSVATVHVCMWLMCACTGIWTSFPFFMATKSYVCPFLLFQNIN